MLIILLTRSEFIWGTIFLFLFIILIFQSSNVLFRMHDEGEIDVRACYTAISVSWFLYFCVFLPHMHV